MKRLDRTALRFRLAAKAASTAAFPATVTTDVTPANPASQSLDANAAILVRGGDGEGLLSQKVGGC